jgi:hypothetical protein
VGSAARASDALRHRFALSVVDIGDDDVRALGGEADGGGRTDA